MTRQRYEKRNSRNCLKLSLLLGALLLVSGHLSVVAFLFFARALFPLGLVSKLSPFLSRLLGDIGDSHPGLGDASSVLGQPDHVCGLGALGRVGVLLRSLRLLRRRGSLSGLGLGLLRTSSLGRTTHIEG